MMENNGNQHNKNQLNDGVIDLTANNVETQEEQGKQIASLLKAHASRLSLRTLKQLENGREQAVKAHMQQSDAINRDGTISSMVYWAEHHRVAATGMLLAAIIAGFALTQAFSPNVEHGDAFLLASELPPEAFVDTAFEPSLNTAHAKI